MVNVQTLRFTTQAQLDIQRITRQLSDLQRQVASNVKANDLQGFGDDAAQLLNAQNVLSASNARADILGQVKARFGVQASALSQVGDSATSLAQSIKDALSANDGRAINTELSLAFSAAVSALNETWDGKPLFAGERIGAGPIAINSLQDLVSVATLDDVFDEASREQTVSLGAGAPIALASKASSFAKPLFNAFRTLQNLLDQTGGSLGAPLTEQQKASLETIAANLTNEIDTFAAEEGRTGQLDKRFGDEILRLQARSNLVQKEIGDIADSDIAAVSIQISALLAQYQAAAKTFSDLSNLSLIPYLT